MKTFSVQSRMDELNLQRLKEIARAKGISISNLIRYILINYIESTPKTTSNHEIRNER